MRRGLFAFWSVQTLAALLIVAIGVANLALFFVATPRPPARASTSSFTETFATTTYRDTANTTATWLGDGSGYMGFGSASSTRYFLENPSTGTNGFESMSCKDGNTCFLITSVAVGTVILRTTDAGATWEIVYSGSLDAQHATSDSALHDVHAVPGTNTVYAAGEETNAGLVLKSTDGGTTWTEANSGFSGTNEFQDISCADASTCVVANNNSSGTRIWYTTNGGTSWTAATTPSGSYTLSGLDFITGASSSTWRAVGTLGTVLVSAATTTPQGWTQETPFTGEELRDVEHLSSGAIHVVGGTAGTTSFMASSTNAGASYATSTHPGTTWIWGIDCGDADTCWTAGGASAGGVRETMRTDNAGNTWTAVASNAPNNVSGGYLRDVAAIDGSTAYVAGGGTATWALVKTSTSTHFTDISVNTLCVYDSSGCTSDAQSISIRGMWMDPTSGQTVYVSGGAGLSKASAKSTNGGESWAFTAADPGDGTPMDCADTQTCYISGLSGFLAKTTNGGTSWTTQTQSSVYDANAGDVDVVTTQMAWVGGGFGSAGKPKLVRTVDGGTTYTAATGTLSSSFTIRSIYAISTTTAWIGGVVAGSAKIYYTTDGGANWTEQFTASGLGINAIFCLPNNVECWATLSDSSGDDNMVKTTNGGVLWSDLGSVIGSVGATYAGMWFLNSSIGYVAGDNCSGNSDKLFVTENGGTSWSKVNFPCMDGEIAFYRNRGVIGGATAANALLGQVGRIVHPFATSTLQSTAVDSVPGNVTCGGITPTQTLNGGTVTYQMSNDGGTTWTSSGGSCGDFSDTFEFAFVSSGSDLRWRATLTGLESSPPTTTPDIDTVAINYSYNTSPNTPINTSPADGATNVLLEPTLTASAFSDPDVGDTHASSRWEVSSVAGNFSSPVFASSSTTNLTSITIPSGTLVNNTTYYWHVKYVDNGGANSAFSTSTSFTTVPAGTTPPASAPPSSPIAQPDLTERATSTITWHFQDTASNESGFSIVDATDSSTVYATTNPIFTQNISELTEVGLASAAEHCNRAVVAFNDRGNSSITASSLYPCTWTLPDAPGTLTVVSSTPTTITLSGIPDDANADAATYDVCEQDTGLCLAPDAAQPGAYALSETAVRQTREQWGDSILVVGLHPNTTYTFRLTAYNGSGEAASGGTVSATTPSAAVMFSIGKAVAVNPALAALAGILFATDFSFAALAALAVSSMAGLALLYRRRDDAPAPRRYVRAHHFAVTAFFAALGAFLLKSLLLGLVLLAPTATYGQAGFPDDGREVVAGDTLMYEVSLRNLGPAAATEVVVTDVIPAGSTYKTGTLTVDGVPKTDACDADETCIADGTVTLRRTAALGVDASTVLTFAVTATGNDGDTIANEGCVVSAELTTPTCSNQTTNRIAAAPVNQNVNQPPTNQNVNAAPPPTNVNRPPAANVNAAPPPPSGAVNANQPPPPAEELPPPPESVPADTTPPPPVSNLRAVLLSVESTASIGEVVGDLFGMDREATVRISGGTSDDTALVRLRIESDPVEVSFAPPATVWARDVTARFSTGEHLVTATAVDAAGNASAPSRTSFVVPPPATPSLPEVLAEVLAATVAATAAVLDDPQVEEVSESVVAPAILTVAAVNVAAAAGIPTLLSFLGLLFTQPALLFARRERKGYGTVFNSLSKLPLDLAIVRVRDDVTKRILQTKVTDKLGRYVFFLSPGRYTLEVTKSGYRHPTTYLAGRTEDIAFTNLFPGTVLAIDQPTRLVGAIPVDPPEEAKPPAALRRAALLRKLQYAFALTGPVVSAVTVLISPTTTVILLAIFQFAVFLLFRRLAYKKPPKSFGIVRDAVGAPVKYAVVRIFETTYNKLLETQVTDARGRYAFLVGPNRYYVTASAPGYATVTSEPLDYTTAVKETVVTKDIVMNPS